MVAGIHHLSEPAGAGSLEFFDRAVDPVLAATGAPPLACFVTGASRNSFPRLPVREGEAALIRFASFPDAAHERHLEALSRSQVWRGELADALAARLKRPREVLRLAPTARSLLRG